MSSILSERTVSGFPLSISTGMAFESVFKPRQEVYDSTRTPPVQINLASYNQLWVNVDTLFRNMMQSCTKAMIDKLGYIEIARELDAEIETIISLLNNEGRGRTAPVFYLCDYEKALEKRHAAISLRKPSSPAQIYLETLRKKTLFYLLQHTDNKIMQFDGAIRLTSMPVSALMMTHYPYDLLSRKFFTKLDLLESNTGKLKTPQQWNSKYYPLPGKDMSILPWYRFMLMTMGDKALIVPQSLKLRTAIYKCASERGWTPATTMDKCMLDLSLDLNPYDYAAIRTF